MNMVKQYKDITLIKMTICFHTMIQINFWVKCWNDRLESMFASSWFLEELLAPNLEISFLQNQRTSGFGFCEYFQKIKTWWVQVWVKFSWTNDFGFHRSNLIRTSGSRFRSNNSNLFLFLRTVLKLISKQFWSFWIWIFPQCSHQLQKACHDISRHFLKLPNRFPKFSKCAQDQQRLA